MHTFQVMIRRLTSVICAVLVTHFLVGCTTTYDAYGRPVQTVDPALAVAGIAAAGLIGYAIAEGDNDDHRHYDHDDDYRYYDDRRHKRRRYSDYDDYHRYHRY